MTTESFTSLWAQVGLLSHPSPALSLSLALPWVPEGEGQLAWLYKEALRCCVFIKAYPVPPTDSEPRCVWIERVGEDD